MIQLRYLAKGTIVYSVWGLAMDRLYVGQIVRQVDASLCMVDWLAPHRFWDHPAQVSELHLTPAEAIDAYLEKTRTRLLQDKAQIRNKLNTEQVTNSPYEE